MKKIIVLIALFLVLVGVGIYLRSLNEMKVIAEQCLKAGGTYDQTERVCDLPDIVVTPPVASSTPSMAERMADLIVVSSPTASSTISSPLTISGQARGYWFFEASFPVELQSATGTVIATGIAQADGEWMTEDFVPFSFDLSYPPQTAGTWGKLILRKDNPSGLPENDAHLEVPVRF
jgi:hypothetical protein